MDGSRGFGESQAAAFLLNLGESRDLEYFTCRSDEYVVDLFGLNVQILEALCVVPSGIVLSHTDNHNNSLNLIAP